VFALASLSSLVYYLWVRPEAYLKVGLHLYWLGP